VELFRVYEKGLAAKARNKSAENAFVSGLYTFYGRGNRPATANNITPGGKKTEENFKRNFTNFIKVLQDPAANATAANKKARQTAVNYYYSLANATRAANNATVKLKEARPAPAPVNNSAFYAKYPNFASGPFRNILNRATNVKKRYQPFTRSPSLTASNAQFQALKALSPNGKTYYGNLPIWKALTPAQVDKFTNLTAVQKNALKRMIRSVRLNNMEPNKSKVRAGRNREELTNNLMKMQSNKNLLNVIKVRVSKRRAPTEWATNNAAPSNKGGSATPAPSRSFVPTYGVF
jgi:hypothetical protein